MFENGDSTFSEETTFPRFWRWGWFKCGQFPNIRGGTSLMVCIGVVQACFGVIHNNSDFYTDGQGDWGTARLVTVLSSPYTRLVWFCASTSCGVVRPWCPPTVVVTFRVTWKKKGLVSGLKVDWWKGCDYLLTQYILSVHITWKIHIHLSAQFEYPSWWCLDPSLTHKKWIITFRYFRYWKALIMSKVAKMKSLGWFSRNIIQKLFFLNQF